MDSMDCFSNKNMSRNDNYRYSYELVKSVYNVDKKLIGYDLRKNETNEICYYPLQDTEHLVKTGKLLLTEEKLDLVPKRVITKVKSIDIRIGKEIVVPNIVCAYNKRFAFKDLIEFLGTDGNRICSLYGLRRTGKTVLMQQAISYLASINELDKVALITINSDGAVGMYELYDILDNLKANGIKYVFIDEITFVRDFISSSSNLANVYASYMRIVITGTDSLGLKFAEEDALFDRVFRINTTYISYKEYKQLFPDKHIDDFLQFGGVLTKSVYNYKGKLDEYINTAIYRNICKSLLRYDNGKFFRPLDRLFGEGNLYSALVRIIDQNVSEFTIRAILKQYKNANLGSAYQILQSRLNLTSEYIDKNISSVSELFLYHMGVKSWESEDSLFISQEALTTIRYQLMTLDMLIVVGNEVIIGEPGLRYFKAKELIEVLLDDEDFKSLDKIKKEIILETIMKDVKGRILEDSILLDTFKVLDPNKYTVSKFNRHNKEIDMLVFDRRNKLAYLFEIKHSDKQVEKQYRWLIDNEIEDYIIQEYDGLVIRRTVLYRGKTMSMSIASNKIVDYINVEEYLSNIKSYF